jgi:hypothetical protein
MPKLSNIELRKAIHILLYGPPKSGKTELYGELAEHGFTLWVFDLENGSLTLSRSVSKDAQDRVNIFKIPDTKDFPIGSETILKVIKPGEHQICDLHGKVACDLCKKNNALFSSFDNRKLGEKDIFIVDSMTQLSNSIMNHIGKGKDDLWKPEWEHYRAQGSMLDRFLSNVQNAPYNVIVVTHESTVELADGGEKIVPIAGTRNFSRNTAKYFDEIVYCEVKNRQHRAASSTTFSLDILTGSRSRTIIEEQLKDGGKKDADGKPVHLSLLPIFMNQGISVNARAENVLQMTKAQVQTMEGSKQ